jgi:hypothetical protein
MSGSSSDSGSGRSNHIRNSLIDYYEADDMEVEMKIDILADHPFKSTKTEISKNSILVSKRGIIFRLNKSDGRACVQIHQGYGWYVLVL